MSWHSFMEGASSTDEMLGRARVLGYDVLALVNRNNVSGTLEFAGATNQPDIKTIIGVTLILRNEDQNTASSSTLLAENHAGYTNMCNLISSAHIGSARIDPLLPSRHIPNRTHGLIALMRELESRIAELVADGAKSYTDKMIHCAIAVAFRQNSMAKPCSRSRSAAATAWLAPEASHQPDNRCLSV